MSGRQHEQGFALVLTLVAVTLLAVASTTTYLAVTSSYRASETRLHALQAMYAAESGLEATLYLLNQDPSLVADAVYSEDDPSLDTEAMGFPEDDLKPGEGLSYQTWFDGSTLVAQGTSGGISQRIRVTIDNEATSSTSFQHAIACQGSITVSQNAAIIGDLRSELILEWLDPTNPYVISGPTDGTLGEEGEIIVGAGGNPDETVDGFNDVPRVSSPNQAVYPDIAVPENLIGLNPSDLKVQQGDVTISQDSAYASMKLTGKGDLIFDTSQSGLRVYVEGDLDSSGQGEIRVTGPNPLYLYVGGSVKMSGQFQADDNAAQFVLVGLDSSGEGEIRLTGQASASTIIYAPEYSVDIQGQGNQTGAIIAGTTSLRGRGRFTYDENLADLDLTDLGAPPTEIVYSMASGTWQKI